MPLDPDRWAEAGSLHSNYGRGARPFASRTAGPGAQGDVVGFALVPAPVQTGAAGSLDILWHGWNGPFDTRADRS